MNILDVSTIEEFDFPKFVVLPERSENKDFMTKSIVIGGCVKIPDGRIARVREKVKNQYKVRVRRKTSESHQFLFLDAKELTPVVCPKGWMSVEGYNRYLKATLAKMKLRQEK